MYDHGVPKRSQQYRDARREQILSAAKRCFVRDGFHETSMQDLFAEAGLSSGAVYRYFASKGDVIVAIAEENMREVAAAIGATAAHPQPERIGSTLASVLDLIRRKNDQDALGPLALLVWAEALRNPALQERFKASLTQIRAELAQVVTQQQSHGAIPTTVDPDNLAGLLLAIVAGFILELTVLGDAAIADIGSAAQTLWPN
jgi:AcrR family transcriptional regulator